MAEIFDPISEEIKRKKLSIASPVIQPAVSRMLLQPAHGPNYVNPVSGLPEAPGIGYIPAPAQEVTRGMGIMDVSSKPTGTGDLPLGFTRDAAGVLRPTGQSTLAGTIIPATPVQAASPVRETAVPAGKPVGPTGATLTETPVASASQSRMDFRVVGPGTIEPSRFVPLAGGGMQINNEAPGVVNYARRQGIGIEGAGTVPGGNVSQYSVSDPAAVAKRQEEGRIAIDQLNTALDRQNIMEGAHGPLEAARAQERIARIDAVRTKGQAEKQNASLEAEKLKMDILKGGSDIAHKNEETAQLGKFKRDEYEKALVTNKAFGGDPDKIGWMTDIAEKRHNKTGVDVSHVLNVYNPSDGKPVALNLYGRVDKGNASKVTTILQNMTKSADKFEKSGAYLTGWNKDTKTYSAQYDAWLEELKKLGVRPITSAENSLL